MSIHPSIYISLSIFALGRSIIISLSNGNTYVTTDFDHPAMAAVLRHAARMLGNRAALQQGRQAAASVAAEGRHRLIHKGDLAAKVYSPITSISIYPSLNCQLYVYSPSPIWFQRHYKLVMYTVHPTAVPKGTACPNHE